MAPGMAFGVDAIAGIIGLGIVSAILAGVTASKESGQKPDEPLMRSDMDRKKRVVQRRKERS